MAEKDKTPKGQKKSRIININFVCSGNTCRSYIAEAIATYFLKTIYFKRKPNLKDRVNIGSAGTDVLFTEIPVNTFRVLDIFEIPNIKFKPTSIDSLIIKSSDLIITMAISHKINIISRFINTDKRKIFSLLELSNIILYIESENIYKRGTIERTTPAIKKPTININIKNGIKDITSSKFSKKTLFPLQQPDKIFNRSGLLNQLSTIDNFFQKLRIIKDMGSESIIKPQIIDIEDPFGRSIDKYIEVAKLIKENIITIFDYLFG
jgi:protein-tyrosine-phosphatase